MGRELQSQDRQQHEQHSEGKRKRMLEPQAQPEQQEGTDLEHQLIQITKRNRKEKRQRGIEDPRQQQQAPEQGVGSQLGQQQQQQQLERKPKKRRHVPEVDIQTEHKKQKKQVDSRELGRDAPQQREQEEEQAKQLQKAERKAKRQQKREEEARQQREQEEEQAKQLQKAERKAKRQQKHEEEARRQREQEQEEEQGRPQQEQQEEPEAIPASSLEPSASQPTPASAAAGASTPGGFKFWSEADAARLVQCVEDDQYRSQHLGEATLDWKAVAAHFGRSTQAVRSKYRHLKLVEEHGTEVFARGRSARAPISYSYMALYALSTLPDQSGTGSEVCAVVERYPVFQPRLDRTFRPDCTGVFRWQQRIREELSHQCIFRATGTKRGGEMVWQLDLSSIDEIPRNLRKKVAEMKLAGAPHMGKHGNSNG